MSFAPRPLAVGRRDDDDEDGDWYIGPKWRLVLASIPVVGMIASEWYRARSESREAVRAQRHETELERFKAKHERRMEELRHRNKCERLARFGQHDATEPGGNDD